MCYSRFMHTPRPYTKVALFVAGLALIFFVAAGVGSLFEPADTEAGKEEEMGSHTAEAAHGGHGGGHAPAGLGISEGGYTLRIASTQFVRGEEGELRFSVEDANGQAVTEFDELHERRLHLIVVRRDGTEFRHLHPEMDEAGGWTTRVELDQPGVYRAFADFSAGGEQHTLAGDLFVSGGEFEARPFPPAQPLASTEGYEVRLQADEPVAGEPASLAFDVSQDGDAVHDLAPYLGAKGHLVALREGDLAFLHVHPEEGHGVDAEEIVFEATFPTAGRYRLYLQFKHEGTVRTAEFTVEVPR
jgi:hypothetical protein